MNWIPQVSSGYFAVAGFICAGGPLLIHLLNRRRFRRVEWAAMEFLVEALHRQKRRLRLRDLILLLMRTAAVLLFGLALAQPYFTSNGSQIDMNSPRHLIVLLDNSLSMGYRQVDTTLLEQAKRQATSLIESLPEGSQVTVAGTCKQRADFPGPFRRTSDALELLTNIPLVDGVSRIEDAVSAAQSAIGTAVALPDQIVYFTDLQRNNWPTDFDKTRFAQLPTIQIRDMSSGTWDNSWVADVRLRDDVVDLNSPSTVFVTIQHQGQTTRHTQISLSVNTQIVATRSIELPPGRTQRQIAFECSFADAAVEPGEVTFVPVQVSITPDRLEQDDQRVLMVPVVTSLPVVFIDQYTDQDEDPALGKLGETRPLRHLLAPQTSANNERPLVNVHHLTISEVNRSLLAQARLVVVAGVADPAPAIDILQQYVQQGGPLVVAAGGSFDPLAWNSAVRNAGQRLLPGPLSEQPLGFTPDEAGERPLEPFTLSFDSLVSNPLLRLPGLSDDELRDFYREPLFFKSVFFQSVFFQSNLVESPSSDTRSDELDMPRSMPARPPASWLTWESPNRSAEMPASSEPTTPPRIEVCASFNDSHDTPFLIRHHLGKGELLFVSTSILPTWNNLAQTNAIVLWDHILRSLIRSTLPSHNFAPQDQLSIPVAAQNRDVSVRLQRPNNTGAIEMVDVGFIGKDQQGVIIPHAWSRGLYRLSAVNSMEAAGQTTTPYWQTEVAVNGDVRESDLTPLSSDDVQVKIVESGLGQPFTGNTLAAFEDVVQGSSIWWWLALTVFILLISELAILAFASRPAPLNE